MADVVASQASVRDLKTHLSEWLARAQSGKVVEVTSHRKPIARITAVKPVAPAPTSPLQKAIDAGLISWAEEMAALARLQREDPVNNEDLEQARQHLWWGVTL